MKILLTGSRDLTDLDKEEIGRYLERYGANHEIVVVCEKCMENEVMKYFIHHSHLADRLRIYTFQPYRQLPSFLKKPIDFLRTEGARYSSFEMEQVQIRRTEYTEAMKEVIGNVDLVMCFYNGDNSKRLIPVDIAKELKVDAMVYDLPGYREEKMKKTLERKVRVV